MKQLTIEAFKGMLNNALTHIKAREEEFSKLDAVIGDGDHGQAIVTAFSVVVKAGEKGTTFSGSSLSLVLRESLKRCSMVFHPS